MESAAPRLQPIPLPGPLTVPELLDRSFRLYRVHFRTFFVFTGLLLLPYLVYQYLFAGPTMLNTARWLQALLPSRMDLRASPEMAAAVALPESEALQWAIVLVGWIYNYFATLAVFGLVLGLLNGRAAPLRSHAAAALRRLWTYCWRWIFAFLVILAIIVPLAIVLAFALVVIGGPQWMDDGVNLLWFYVGLVILMMIPVAYYFGRWMVADVGLLEQEWGAVESLRKSWRMTVGYRGRSMLYMILLLLLNIAVTTLPNYAVQTLLLASMPKSAFAASVAIASIAQNLMVVLWTPIWCAAIVFYYYDLRVRKEGFDIEQRVRALEARTALRTTETADAEPAA